MLDITNLTFRMQGRLLIEDASLHVPDGSKLGLVGRNGCGKSTLFKLITGDLSPESGDVSLKKGLKLGQVAQEAPGGPERLIDVVLAADPERLALLEESETATDPDRIAEIHTRLTDIDAHSAEARAGAILSGLGFDAATQLRPCSEFSGGWRMRVALAAVLFAEPDLLLLDEPTNYLDLEGTLWLENYLVRYPHTIVLISHDRDLLNRVCSTIAHLDGGRLHSYKGDFDFFEKTRAEKLALQGRMKEKQDAKRKHMEAFIDRFRYKASKARQAQSRIKALEKMEQIAAVARNPSPPITIPSPEKQAASPIILLDEVTVGYEPGKPILSKLDLRIDGDDRIALLGANGNGKSTFAKLLADRLKQETGNIVRADKLKVAMFAQHQLDDLIPESNAIEHVRRLMPDAPEAKVRARVAQFGLGTEKMLTAARDLSGGEKARLLIGLATFDGAHLLILDEPTNHLDMEARDALMMALYNFSGAVIVISHDRHLVEASAERLWLVSDGSVAPFDGDMADYRRWVLRGDRPAKQDGAQKGASTSQKEKRKAAVSHRNDVAPLRKKIAQFETMVTRADAALAEIDDRINQAAKNGQSDRIVSLTKKKAEIQARRDEAEEEWFELASQLEGLGV
ncbi:MAG: ABC-F family ATP-binding cassette domain-containing protein [Pseudomonadota bacterium]